MRFVRKYSWLIMKSDRNWRMDEFFDFYRISRKKRNELLQKGKVKLNHQAAQLADEIKTGDEIALECFADEDIDVIPDEKAADVLYEDDFVLVANKPPGMLVHSDGTGKKRELNALVARYYLDNHIQAKVRPVHRLDEDTSGCVLYSKCAFFQPFLDAMLSEKKIRREYLALAEGVCGWSSKRITLPIGRDRHQSGRQRISQSGKEAITNVRVLQRDPKERFMLLHCELETGRTHQIRVHLAALGHPLLSDPLYGQKSALIQRCALHAVKICWYDPCTLELKEVKAPLPADMQRLFSTNWG